VAGRWPPFWRPLGGSARGNGPARPTQRPGRMSGPTLTERPYPAHAGTHLSPVDYQIGVTQGGIITFCLIAYCLPPTNETRNTVHPVSNPLMCQRVHCGVRLHSLSRYAIVMNGRMSKLTAPKHIHRQAAWNSFIWTTNQSPVHEPTTQDNEVLLSMTCAHSNNCTSPLFGLASFNPSHLLDDKHDAWNNEALFNVNFDISH
jgi:hypothetical protein